MHLHRRPVKPEAPWTIETKLLISASTGAPPSGILIPNDSHTIQLNALLKIIGYLHGEDLLSIRESCLGFYGIFQDSTSGHLWDVVRRDAGMLPTDKPLLLPTFDEKEPSIPTLPLPTPDRKQFNLPTPNNQQPTSKPDEKKTPVEKWQPLPTLDQVRVAKYVLQSHCMVSGNQDPPDALAEKHFIRAAKLGKPILNGSLGLDYARRASNRGWTSTSPGATALTHSLPLINYRLISNQDFNELYWDTFNRKEQAKEAMGWFHPCKFLASRGLSSFS